MRYLLLILSFFCLKLSAQKVIIVDKNTNIEYEKNFPSRSNVIPGLEDNLKVYIVLQKPQPSYDNLTEKLIPVKRFTDSIAGGNQYPYVVKEWQKVVLPDSIIKKNRESILKQKESDELYKMPDIEFRRFVLITLSALIDQNNKQSLDPIQIEAIDSIYNFGSIVNNNYKQLKDSKKAISKNLNIKIK